MLKLLVVLTTSSYFFSTVNSGDLIGVNGPSVVKKGEDVLLTCVVSGTFANKTVIWRKNNAILSAGMYTVTNDPRIKVLHDDDPGGPSETAGGDVWVLHIKQVKSTDSGSYICEINTDPVLRSIRILTVEEFDPNSHTKKNASTTNDKSRGGGATTSETNSGGGVDGFLVPPPLTTNNNNDNNRSPTLWRSTVSPQLSHDFTECCEKANVTSECIGFCNVHNILDGTTGIEPEACERDFPNIVKCMADGRNHVPCCVEKQVPDLCQDMCRGEYTPFTDLLKTRVSCVHHTLSGLQCILQGVQMIPSTPQDVYVEPLTETSVEVGWSAPLRLPDAVKFYTVNLTAMHFFDDDDDNSDINAGGVGGAGENSSTTNGTMTMTTDIKKMTTTMAIRIVPANQTTILVNDLSPLTMYAVQVLAQNEYGSSLPSNSLRIFTHVRGGGGGGSVMRGGGGAKAMTTSGTVPDLPDIRTCCVDNGMTHRMCLDKMCDPRKTDLANLPDFMVCAPWSNITFTCLANKIDHTPCCRARGIPDTCFPLCSGKITTLDFSLFKCLRFMSDYSSCLFQGYGVLAGPPSKLKSIVIASTFLILDWNKPKKLADSVTTYHVKYRRLGIGEDYKTIEKKYPPLILEGLQSDVYYECYVVSINAYGKSEASSRLIVRTKPQEIVEESPAKYNMSTCCQASGLLPQCRPLCSYDIRMSDIEKLGPVCQAQMAIIARCAAGGRDHTPCCNRRGVIPSCASLCRGVLPASPSLSSPPSMTPDCLAFAGNILQCFEEGTENIPSPPEDVHVTAVTKTTINLSWLQPDFVSKDDNVTAVADVAAAAVADAISSESEASDIDFIVQYGKVNNMTMYETVAKLENELTTDETSVELTNLEPHSLYRIVVVTRNKHGTSLPSSMLLINTTEQAADTNMTTFGAPSPPHSLAITAHSATWVQLSWQPPEFSHPHERISYRVHHKVMQGDKYQKTDTRLLWMRLDDLKPSSQHILYVEAIGEKATSLPSETLVAWTDPALPAFVDPPTVHPPDNIAVGGSMTILCLALGNPPPTISLYVGGHLVRQDTSRHMVTVIHNVTTDMEHVSCYADNGYGIPMQAIRKINICFPPRVQASGIIVRQVGEQVELKCTVKARPPPKMIFWRDHDGRIPVIQGGNFDINIQKNESDPTIYSMRLRINKLKATDVGDYFCHAVNAFGTTTAPVSVRIRTTPALNRNVSECCDKQNVSAVCREACSYYVDFDAIANKPECIVDFDKLMKCAADGSDHRSCCADANVPRKCMDWCRGEPVKSREICSIQFSRTIVGCFEENRDRLPGPPENIAVNVVADNEVTISWDPPSKNPNAVEGYRIFYHEVVPSTGAFANGGESSSAEASELSNNTTITTTTALNITEIRKLRRLDVKETTVSIDGLKRDVLYELVVKAGNNFGASVLSSPVKFTLGDHQMTSASYSNTVGTVSGILASMLAILLAVTAVIFYQKHRSSEKAANGVAFENPTYTRGLEHVQLPTVTMHSGSTMSPPSPIKFDESGAPSPPSAANNNDGPMMATEVNPSIYEELKLGSEGAGFRKLVS